MNQSKEKRLSEIFAKNPVAQRHRFSTQARYDWWIKYRKYRKSLQKTKKAAEKHSKKPSTIPQVISDANLQRCIADFALGRFKLTIHEIKATWFYEKRGKPKDSLCAALILTHRPTNISCVAYDRPRKSTGRRTKQQMKIVKEEILKQYLPFITQLVEVNLKTLMQRQFGPLPKEKKHG